jgi:hypothetical protein
LNIFFLLKQSETKNGIEQERTVWFQQLVWGRTSLHACWAEEKGNPLLLSAATAVAPAEIGFVKAKARKN